jgi:ABC-type multidrug transport system permease subunit
MLPPPVLQISITLPFNLLAAVAYCLIVYGMTGLATDAHAITQATTLATILSLISVQVRLQCSTHYTYARMNISN